MASKADKYESLILEWAEEQGFEGFLRDHGSVMNNLSKWLDSREGKCLSCRGSGVEFTLGRVGTCNSCGGTGIREQ